MQYITINNKKSFTFAITDADGSPTILSEATVKFIIKKDKNALDTTAILSGQYVNPATNILMFEFDATDTEILEEGVYSCALKIFRPENMNEEVWADEVTVLKGVFYD